MMKNWAVVAVLLTSGIVGACGASLNGPATTDENDPCKGHLNCGWACCWSANSDGEGFSCNSPGSARACEYIGLSPDPNGSGEFTAPKPVDRPKPHDDSRAPDAPPPVRHDGRG